MGKAYGAFDPSEPDYPRRITYVVGADGKIAAAWETVKPKFHMNEVLKSL